jgi:hypothetical protein
MARQGRAGRGEARRGLFFCEKGENVMNRRRKLSELVLDYEIYPRHKVDPMHVADMERAFLSGVVFPPIVICAKSKRIVDGFNRYTMFKRQNVEEVEVEERKYKNEAALFADAVGLQSSHGQNLSRWDRTRCAFLAEKLGMDDVELAAAMHVDPKYIGELRIDRQAQHGNLQVPLKRTIKHKSGQELSEGQMEANKRLGGMNQRFYVNQVILLIENELIDQNDESLLEALRKLQEMLEKLLIAG